jgi:hypothetical protein
MHETLLVADSSPLIVLAKIGRLGLLPHLAERVVIPSAVWQEVVMNKPASLDSRELAGASWLEVQPVTDVESAAWRDELDPGEAEAIALASKFPGCRLLIDERMGRRAAGQLGVRVIGTLGLLLEAKASGLIPSLRAEIDRLLSAGHFLSESLIQETLHSANEG